MEITYKFTNQEMKEILSKELGTPIVSFVMDTDGNFIAKTLREKTTVGNIAHGWSEQHLKLRHPLSHHYNWANTLTKNK